VLRFGGGRDQPNNILPDRVKLQTQMTENLGAAALLFAQQCQQ
jgi:hypothetical protein